MGTERFRGAIGQVSSRFDTLERHPVWGFPIASYRRFKEIDGKTLAFVIGGNMFVSVIPLFIVGYAILEAFNPDRSIAVVVIQRFHLSGDTAALVRQTFGNARSGRNVALSLSIVSLFVTGFGVATTVQTAYARAFRVTPLRGGVKFIRGGAWLALMLTPRSRRCRVRLSPEPGDSLSVVIMISCRRRCCRCSVGRPLPSSGCCSPGSW